VDDTIRRQLVHVRVSDPAVCLERFPDFFIVGPQRTGTTWLHAHLRFHPQVFLAEPKELFFFSRLTTPEHPGYQSNDLGWYLQFFHDPPWRSVAKNLLTLWRYREPYRPIVRGEATASYAAIDPSIIRDIALLKPHLKVILMIRNPIDRAWSHAKKDLVRKRQRKVAEVPPAEFEAFFRDPYQRQCARYVEHYDNWSGVFGAERVFVGHFDDITSRPEALLLDVMQFLGVRRDAKYIGSAVREAVNPTESSVIPERYRTYLNDLLGDDMRRTEARFGLSWGG
jgi:hypothetical protein